MLLLYTEKWITMRQHNLTWTILNVAFVSCTFLQKKHVYPKRKNKKNCAKGLGMSLIPHDNWANTPPPPTFSNDRRCFLCQLFKICHKRCQEELNKVTCQWMNHYSTTSDDATTRLQRSALFVCLFLEFAPKTFANRWRSICGTNAGPLQHAPHQHGAMGENNTLCAQSSVDPLSTDHPGNRCKWMAGCPWLQTEALAERKKKTCPEGNVLRAKKIRSQKKIRCMCSSKGNNGVMKEHH